MRGARSLNVYYYRFQALVLNVFPNSPIIDSITVKHHGQIHQGKFYYLFELNGKRGVYRGYLLTHWI
ncbi:50S ribosomal protein L19 [Gilliamella sp. Pas-s25]|uniref:50S ribosomal protein L19 n=1 Tax=Gilliamella sp. Pas-s25 TaxID=2687310 RepID=UPI00135D689A|nr:50S ribosomal protein L19 [Gilliamella sp. Pas-s25]